MFELNFNHCLVIKRILNKSIHVGFAKSIQEAQNTAVSYHIS